MNAVGFAALSALCFGLSYVVASRALRESSVLAGVLISMVCTWAATTVGVLARMPQSVALVPVLFFLGAGLFSPGVSRVVDMTAVQRLGAAASVPIQAGMRPLFSLLAGVLLLGEGGGLPRIVGVGLISAGLVGALRAGPTLRAARPPADALAARPPTGGANGGAPGAGDAGGSPTTGGSRRRPPFRAAMLLPFGAAACFVASDLCKKVGLETLDEPVFAAWVAVTGSLVAWLAVGATRLRSRQRLRVGRSWPLFCVSGAFTGLAQIALFFALRLGDVAVVGPVSSLAPVVVLLVSRLMLRGIEEVGWLRLAFLLAIVAGAISLNWAT